MSRIIWTSGVGSKNLEQNAAETLHQIGCALDSLSQAKDVRGSPVLLDTMMAHWQINKCNLSLAMNTLPTSDVLESIFSFQPDHVQVFVNTEGAYPEDVSVLVLPAEGGFDLSVRHKDVRWGAEGRSCAQRLVSRNYRFLRPLDWTKAEYRLSDDGIFQLRVPGPQPALQQLPFQHLQCTTDRNDLYRG